MRLFILTSLLVCSSLLFGQGHLQLKKRFRIAEPQPVLVNWNVAVGGGYSLMRIHHPALYEGDYQGAAFQTALFAEFNTVRKLIFRLGVHYGMTKCQSTLAFTAYERRLDFKLHTLRISGEWLKIFTNKAFSPYIFAGPQIGGLLGQECIRTYSYENIPTEFELGNQRTLMGLAVGGGMRVPITGPYAISIEARLTGNTLFQAGWFNRRINQYQAQLGIGIRI